MLQLVKLITNDFFGHHKIISLLIPAEGSPAEMIRSRPFLNGPVENLTDEYRLRILDDGSCGDIDRFVLFPERGIHNIKGSDG